MKLTVARNLTICVMVAFAGSTAAQQAYPSKPIRVIVPYAPGGSNSTVTRLVTQKLTERLGQQVIVDNRGGGNSLIGTDVVAKSPPDGYTLLSMPVSHVFIPLLYPAPYDPIQDFSPVATFASSEYVLVIHPSVPANNLREFIALAKSKAGQLNFSSNGGGSMSHLAGELLNITADIKTEAIHYKGGGPALTDLIGGQVQFSFQPPINVLAHIKSGKLKAIAFTGETRFSSLPHVPTVTESGLQSFNVRLWYGIAAPAGTPKGVIDKLSTEIATIMSMPDLKEKLVSQGMDPFISTPTQLAALMKAEMAKYAKIIKTANVKPE